LCLDTRVRRSHHEPIGRRETALRRSHERKVKRARLPSLLVEAAAFLLLAVFALAPLAVLLRPGIFAFTRELRDPGTLEALGNALLLWALATAAVLPVGTGLAWLIERTDLLDTDRAKSRLTALLSLPLAIPPYLLAMAWALLGNGRNGLLNRLGSSP